MAKLVCVVLLVSIVVLATTCHAEDEQRIIELQPNERVVMSAEEAIALRIKGTTFRDVTESVKSYPWAAAGEVSPALQQRKEPQPQYPESLHQVAYAEAELFPKINVVRLERNLQNLTELFTRYYKTETGIDSSRWFFNEYLTASIANSRLTQTSQFVHPQFPSWQRSVVTVLPGARSDERVIIGGHIDSVTWPFAAQTRSPGADDDGSGSVCILEAFNVLLESGYRPLRTVEFHGYAAEEVGLYGSEDIAASYAAQGVRVTAMLNLDMTGYPDPDDSGVHIGVTTDGTDEPLNAFLTKLILGYTDAQPENVTCGYACSDFASWTENGYPSCFPQESGNYKQIHTRNDVVSNLSPAYMTQFVRLALGFIVELAGVVE